MRTIRGQSFISQLISICKSSCHDHCVLIIVYTFIAIDVWKKNLTEINMYGSTLEIITPVIGITVRIRDERNAVIILNLAHDEK
jgi:hypothetical protein